MIERCKTGILALDDILQGGIPRQSSVLLSGGSGMGKTTLAMQYLSYGASEGENGLFVSVTEPLSLLTRNIREYAFLDPDHLEDHSIRMIDLRAVMQRMGWDGNKNYQFEDPAALVEVFEGIVKEYNIKRMVIDSVTAICQRLETQGAIRDFIFQMGLMLSELDCTTILTSETPPRELKFSMFGVEEFISDGIIFLSEMERRGDLLRTLQVMKMRGTAHDRSKHLLDLSPLGVGLSPLLKDASEVQV